MVSTTVMFDVLVCGVTLNQKTISAAHMLCERCKYVCAL